MLRKALSIAKLSKLHKTFLTKRQAFKKNKIKIGVLSDSHKKVKKAKVALDMLIREGAEFIVHAGDIVEVETLELLKNCGLRYVAVYGNNDAHLATYHSEYNLVQEPHYFKIANTKFKLMHLPYYMSADAEVIIFGHTHEFASEFNHGTLYLNPGEICARSKPLSECVLLEVNKKSFTVRYFSAKSSSKEAKFKEKKFTYRRQKNG